MHDNFLTQTSGDYVEAAPEWLEDLLVNVAAQWFKPKHFAYQRYASTDDDSPRCEEHDRLSEREGDGDLRALEDG